MASTDRFYTAPQGPDVSPDTEMPRNAEYRIASSPDMFGGLIAKGLSEAGKGLTDAYNVYGQVAADQATNNFLGKLTDLRTEFENTRGQDTINAWRGLDGAPGYPQRAQALFDEARGTVPGGFQNAFDNVGRRYLFASNSAGNSHFRSQSGEWAKTVATTTDQKAINSISSHPNDDATFNANVDSMAHASVVQAQIAYGIHEGTTDPDAQMITKEAHDIAVARAWYTRIEAVRQTNPQQALQWQKEHADELGKLGPQVQNQMRGYLGQSQTTEWDRQASAATAGGGPAVATQPTDSAYYSKIPKPEDGVYAKVPAVGQHGEDQLSRFKQWNPDPVGNSAANLATVHPDLQSIVRKAQADNPNLPFVVALGKSTPAQEALATSWGWGQAGTNGSHHLRGDVVDLWPLDKQGHVVFDKGQQKGIADAMNKAADDLGFKLRWGGLAKEGGANQKFRDAPNFELLNPRPEPQTYGAQAPIRRPDGTITYPASSSPISDVYFHPDTLQAYKARTAQIENPGGNPYATSSAGATGKYQFIPATWRRYGGGSDIHGDQESAMDRLTMDNAKTMSYALGRAPQLWELYLGHQQGPMGAYHLLTEPNRRAGDIVGNAAIRGNGGDPNAPASAFTAMWHAKFGNMSGGPIYAGGGQPGNVTVQSATNPHVQFTGPPSDPFISGQTASATPGGQPVMPAAGPDQGSSEGQSVQPAAYQPMGLVGGGGGGPAPNIQQPGMETAPPQSSPFISPEERAYHEKDDELRRKMLWVINNDKIPEGGTPTAPGKEEMLRNYERDRDGLKIGYHQDAEYRKYVANQARAGIAQIIDKGDYLGAVKATNDALASGRIDEQAWATMNSVIQRRSGDPDIGALGPGIDNVVRGIIDGKITSPEGIDRMYADHQIGWVGRQRALDVLKEHISGEREGIHVQELHVIDTAKQWFRWEMPGPTPGTSIANPNGPRMFGNFLKQFYTDMGSQKTQDPGLLKFDYFDGDKLDKMLKDKYPDRVRNMEQGAAGMSKMSADQAATLEQAWHGAPPPAGASQIGWTSVLSQPPVMANAEQSFPLPHPRWAQAVGALFAKANDPHAVPDFNELFGPKGTIAIGPDARLILQQLMPSARRGEEIHGAQTRGPYHVFVVPSLHPPDVTVDWRKANPGNIVNNPPGPTIHVPMPKLHLPTLPEMSPEAEPWSESQ